MADEVASWPVTIFLRDGRYGLHEHIARPGRRVDLSTLERVNRAWGRCNA